MIFFAKEKKIVPYRSDNGKPKTIEETPNNLGGLREVLEAKTEDFCFVVLLGHGIDEEKIVMNSVKVLCGCGIIMMQNLNLQPWSVKLLKKIQFHVLLFC